MNYDFSKFKEKLSETKDWMSSELSSIRTGRATPNLIEKVMVESYGAKVPLNQIASVSVEDAKTLRISPWDRDQIKSIQSGIEKANLGVSVSADEQGLRIIFPELTEESRKSLSKIINDRAEKAKVSVRKEREEVWNDIQNKEKKNDIGEDDKFRFKDELQKMVDDTIKSFEDAKDLKIKEVSW
jgi:ribosome recycling factor